MLYLKQRKNYVASTLFLVIFVIILGISRNSSPINYEPNQTKFLEEATGEQVKEWASTRTKSTKEYLKKSLFYNPVNQTIKEVLYDKNKLLNGSIHKGYVYNFWTDEKNPQGIWRRTLLGEYAKDQPKWEILIDFDEFSKKMKRKMMKRWFSGCPPHDRNVLVFMSFGGNDEVIFKEWDRETKQFVEDGFESKNTKGEWVGGKLTDAIWIDENNILCNVVLDRKNVSESLYPNTLYLWKRGTPIEQAQKILEIPSFHQRITFSRLLAYATHTTLFSIRVWKDFYNSDRYIFDSKSFTLQKIKMPSDVNFEGSFKEYVFYKLNSDWNVGPGYKKGSVIVMHWQDLLKDDDKKTSLQAIYIPQEKECFDYLAITKNNVFLVICKNINSEVYILELQDDKWAKKGPVILPDKIATVNINWDQNEEQALMYFENPLTPPSVYIWKNKEFKLIRKPIHKFDSQNYVAEQHHAISRDGQKIPYYISYKKGLAFDGKNPTILTAYGGFGHINLPYYSNFMNKVWLDNGGVYVLANIRGGGEFGPEWHTAAKAEKRQVGFDDFVAIAKDLIKNGVTSPEHLGIEGGSNGGLLVSVSMTQHPELFGAIVCEVPIADMLRYTEFGAGPSWIAEYGDPKDYKMRKCLKKYSPIENIYKNKKYPPILITSAANDQRVHPWHARILQYLLEKAQHKSLYIENNDAGHGTGVDLNDRVEYWSAIYTFFAINLGLKVS